MSQPVIGTGDGSTLKEAEKNAALHACLQLYTRGLFTPSNLPTRTRGMITPLNVVSNSGPKNRKNTVVASDTDQSFAPAAAASGMEPAQTDGKMIELSNGERISLEEARGFMDFYCE